MLRGHSSEACRQNLSSSTGGLGIRTHDWFQSNTPVGNRRIDGIHSPAGARSVCVTSQRQVPAEGHPPVETRADSETL